MSERRHRRLPVAAQGSSWPTGALGDLTVGAGVTVTLNVGQVYDYNNVTIAATGRLRFRYSSGTTDSALPAVLGVKGNFVLNGEIDLINSPLSGGGSETFGPYTITAPDGYTFSYSPQIGGGGDGGPDGGLGGNGTGDAGGGGGNGTGSNSDGAGNGGAGGNGLGSTAGAGGAGGTIYSGIGTNGGASDGDLVTAIVIGGAGGGGALGFSGGGLYWKCAGTCSGTGSIVATGSLGGNGGNGGNSTLHKITAGVKLSYGGGGGGGGAGGAGGKIVGRYKGSAPAWTYLVYGGSGGLGGTGGIATADSGSAVVADGYPGSDGSPGTTGVTDIASY